LFVFLVFFLNSDRSLFGIVLPMCFVFYSNYFFPFADVEFPCAELIELGPLPFRLLFVLF